MGFDRALFCTSPADPSPRTPSSAHVLASVHSRAATHAHRASDAMSAVFVVGNRPNASKVIAWRSAHPQASK